MSPEPGNDVLWDVYARTLVDLFPPDRPAFRIVPAPEGITGTWPIASRSPIHVLTAWNPGAERPGERVNRRREEELEGELARRGLETWPAIGRGPEEEGPGAFREEGVAVLGCSRAEALALGSRYRQAAIFSWSPEAWRLLSCLDGRHLRLGFRLEGLAPASP